MAKLTIARVFEQSQIAATNAFKDLAPFFDYFGQLTDNVVRILTNGVSLSDNIDGKSFTHKLKHNQPLNISMTKRPVEVRIQKKVPMTPSITSFDWQINGDETIQLLVKFDDVNFSDAIDVTFYAHFS